MSKISNIEYRNKATGRDETRGLYFRAAGLSAKTESVSAKSVSGAVEPEQKVITIEKE